MLFQRAKAIWVENPQNKWNQFIGFIAMPYCEDMVEIHISARSLYRLYIDGKMIANGPARTAKGYSRVDVIKASMNKESVIAVEVIALGKPDNYCNDCTLEPGLFVCEIIDSNNNIISYTGDDKWHAVNLSYRREMVELLSHSRGIIEYYDLDTDSFNWMYGKDTNYTTPVIMDSEPAYLERHTKNASLKPIIIDRLICVSDRKKSTNAETPFLLKISEEVNPLWYKSVPSENRILREIFNEKDDVFSGAIECDGYIPGDNPAAIMWMLDKSELGFIDFDIKTENELCLDIINSDHLTLEGELKGNTYVTRYKLAAGKYHLTTFEPKLVRFLKVILRTKGKVSINNLRLLDYSYPDDRSGDFSCSDGELNAIYEGARRSLRLTTLDIFMDCPQRERGGWLCDSYFSGIAAWQLFGDTSVERDFLENYLLTSGEEYDKKWFPDVYPGVRPDGTPGIRNWSFWLLEELADYYERSGDVDLLYENQDRIEEFVNEVVSCRGESGLLENLDSVFVDWSISNRSFSCEPISIPVNCLFVHALNRIARLLNKPKWIEIADEMSCAICKLTEKIGLFGGGGDAATFKDGKLTRGECLTEAGIALELWSGFHRADKDNLKLFLKTMGNNPSHPSNPNIGKSNMFIGLMIRFDVLRRLGYAKELVRELKDVYLHELKIGSGTFFENVNGISGCHGFNGAAGAFLTNVVLGLSEPLESEKKVTISPHVCGLRWAMGTATCSDGKIFLKWGADEMEHILDMRLTIPKGWTVEYDIPFELLNWKIIVNGEVYNV